MGEFIHIKYLLVVYSASLIIILECEQDVIWLGGVVLPAGHPQGMAHDRCPGVSVHDCFLYEVHVLCIYVCASVEVQQTVHFSSPGIALPLLASQYSHFFGCSNMYDSGQWTVVFSTIVYSSTRQSCSLSVLL